MTEGVMTEDMIEGDMTEDTTVDMTEATTEIAVAIQTVGDMTVDTTEATTEAMTAHPMTEDTTEDMTVMTEEVMTVVVILIVEGTTEDMIVHPTTEPLPQTGIMKEKGRGLMRGERETEAMTVGVIVGVTVTIEEELRELTVMTLIQSVKEEDAPFPLDEKGVW
mmetsp:Transcript_18569/g.29098  ORF Transcript_18569/g.29098 Transcript_18569/m.29098 type:complete len:164 (-) Transcript_18569:115-606(-)